MTAITSYAQNFEDVMLWRALGHIQNGCYIDIGAQDPVIDSVSLVFHEHGWKGTHVEPTPSYAEMIRRHRPGDQVIQAAVDAEAGVIQFFEIPETGISTGDAAIAQLHRERGFDVHEISVVTITLDAILKNCAAAEIHWLKIDVEGFEQQVLISWGASAKRPWIVVVESTLPLTQIDTHETWEPVLLGYGYTSVYFDGLNRYYLSNAHPELRVAFLSPPNVFDGFSLNGTASNTFHHLIEARHKQQISDLVSEIDQLVLANKNEIDRLNQNLLELNQGHAEQLHTEAVGRDEIEARYRQQISDLVSEIDRLVLTNKNEIDRLNQNLLELNQGHDEQLQAASVSRIDIENQLESMQRRFESVKSEIALRHQTDLLHIERLHSEQVRLQAERISTLSHELHGLHTDHAAREQIRAEKAETLKQELVGLLHAQARREQEVAGQLTAIQQQATQEKAALARNHHEQVQALRWEHADREQVLRLQWQANQQELRRLEQERIRREDSLLDQVSATRLELNDCMRAQIRREQEIAEQLFVLQQQAQQELSEQAKYHSEQMHALQGEHVCREKELSQKIAELHDEMEILRHTQQMRQQQHGFELDRNLEKHKSLIEASAKLEQQLRAELHSEQQISLQLQRAVGEVQHSLALTHASFTWRATAPLRKLTSFILHKKKADFSADYQKKINTADSPSFLELPTINIQHSFNEPIMFSNAKATNLSSSIIASSLDELFAHNGQYFIGCAYQTLLGREPDTEGKAYYLRRLRSGFSKMQIVAQLRLSKEGTVQNVNLPGLESAMQRYQRGQYALVGWLFRLFEGSEGSRPMERKLRAIEQQLCLFSDESRHRFNQIESALTDLHCLVVHQMQDQEGDIQENQHTSPEVETDIIAKLPEPKGFNQLTPRAKEIYLKLKDAKKLRTVKAS